MAFDVKFALVTKKQNSTQQPAEGDYLNLMQYECVLKDGCDILMPVIKIVTDQSKFSPIVANYCFIPAFNRYYYVTWRYESRAWWAYLTVDVLASWKTPIGNSTLYITRAADTGITNGRISDAAYPTEATPQVSHTAVTAPWENSGSYVIGVSCSPPLGLDFGLQVGGTSYFVATPAAMAKLAKTLLSDSWVIVP